MTNAVITWLEAELTKAKALVETDVSVVETEFSTLYAKLEPGLRALVSKILSTIGTQGVTIIEQGVSDLVTVIESGGNIGAAVTALIPQVTAQVSTDLKQDASTAAHGAAELLIAALPVPAAANIPPAPAA